MTYYWKGRCEAVKSDASPCTSASKGLRANIEVCGTHSEIYDGFAELLGHEIAGIRITKGRAACGDIEQLALNRGN